jgi:hypothetical protein
METSQRRRVVFATALTVVALPSIWLIGRDDPSVAPNLAAAGVPTPQPDTMTTEGAAEIEMPVFLENTLVVPPPLLDDAAAPETTSTRTLQGDASHLPVADSVSICTAPRVPGGATVTVTNLDNGLTITCTNQLGTTIPYGIEIALDADLFVQFADLADAPVPVRISW